MVSFERDLEVDLIGFGRMRKSLREGKFKFEFQVFGSVIGGRVVFDLNEGKDEELLTQGLRRLVEIQF